jgi:hypothetical protein
MPTAIPVRCGWTEGRRRATSPSMLWTNGPGCRSLDPPDLARALCGRSARSNQVLAMHNIRLGLPPARPWPGWPAVRRALDNRARPADLFGRPPGRASPFREYAAVPSACWSRGQACCMSCCQYGQLWCPGRRSRTAPGSPVRATAGRGRRFRSERRLDHAGQRAGGTERSRRSLLSACGG